MIKILYTTPEIMHPAAGGPYLRVENSIKALSKISELHIISRAPKSFMGGDEAEVFYKKIAKFFYYAPSLAKKSANKNLKYRIEKMFGLIKHSNLIDLDAKYIIDYAKKNKINIIWFGYGNISYDLMKKIKELKPSLKLICDTDSVWSRFLLRELPYVNDEGRKEAILKEGQNKEQEEADWVNFCDVTTAVSEVDAQYYRDLATEPHRIKLFSNVIDLDSYKIKLQPPENFKRLNIYIAGTFWKESPMEKATRWVIDDILPIVRKSVPNIHFYIIGRDSDMIMADIKDENISITGRLDSVLPYLFNAKVALVPLKFESGTRFKILEAAACNIPIVSTTLGAEGIPIENGKNILIADEAQEFADAIIKVIQNPVFAENMAEKLKKYIEENYSIQKHSKEAQEIIEYISKDL